MAEGKKLIVEIVGSTVGLSSALAKASGDVEKFGGKMAAIGSKVTSVGKSMTMGLTLPIVGIGVVAVKAAMDAEQSTARMDTAFKNVGVSVKGAAGQVDALETSGRNLGFTNAQVEQSIGSLVTSTGSLSKAHRELAIAENLARFKNTDLATATKALTMANTGSMRPLKQLGIDVPKVTAAVDALKKAHQGVKGPIDATAMATAKLRDKEATHAEMLKIVQGLVKGQGAAYAGTAAGGMAVFRAQLDNLLEKLGKALIPVLDKVVGWLSSALSWFDKLSPSTKKWAEILIGALALIGPALIVVGAAFDAVAAAAGIATALASPWILLAAAVVLVAGAITAAVVAPKQLQDALEKMGLSAKDAKTVVDDLRAAFTAIKTVVDAVWPVIKAQIVGALNLIIGAVKVFSDLLKGDWSKLWTDLKALVMSQVNAIVNVAKAEFGLLVRVLTPVWNAVKSAATAAWNAIVSGARTAWNSVVSAINGVLGRAAAAAKAVGTAIVNGIVNVVKTIAGKVKAAFSALWSAIASAATTAYSGALAIGRAIVQGAIDGITSLAGSLISKAKSLASDALGALGSVFSIGSPSKKTHYFGQMLGQGLIDGMTAVTKAVIDAGGMVGGKLMDAIYKSLVAGGAKPKAAIKQALEQATAAQPAIDAAARTLGRRQAEAIAMGFLQASPPLWAQIKAAEQAKVTEMITAAAQKVTDARSAFTTAFGDLANSALAAFDAKVSAWVPPAQAMLNKINLQAQIATLGDQAGQGVVDLYNKISAALTAGNVKLADQLTKQLEGSLTSAIASAQGDVASAQAAVNAAPGDSEAQARLDAAKQRLQDLLAAQQTVLGLIAAQEQAAHDKAMAADRIRFAARLQQLQNALAAHPQEHDKIQKQIIALLQKYVPAYLTKGKAQADAIAAGLRASIPKVASAADALAKAVLDKLNLTATVTVNVEVAQGGMGAKALGGPVAAGMPYLVGEVGPELFVPKRAGTIIPNNQLAKTGTATASGGTQVFQVILDRKVLAEVVRDELGRTQHRNNATAF